MAMFNNNEFEFELEDQKFCPICGSEEIKPHITYNYKFIGGSAPLTYFVCRSCSHQFMTPRPTDRSLELVYSQGIYRALLGQSGVNKGLPTLENFYEESIRSNRLANEIIRLIEKKSIYVTRIADVGGSTGLGIYGIAKAINAITGAEPRFVNIEPDSTFAYEGRKVGIPDVRSISQAVDLGPFDLVVCSHVLEHMNRPLDFLKEMKTLGTTGTTYFIEVPHPALGHFAYSIFHPQVFTKNSLEILATAAGMEPMYYIEVHKHEGIAAQDIALKAA